MKKIMTLFFIITICFLFSACGNDSNKTKEEKLYFDDTGIAEVSHIAYTSEDTFDLKTIFKVGDRLSMYNDRKIGVTTYDDIFFYLYEWGSSTEYPLENDYATISSDGIITRKQKCTVTVYAELKDNSTEPEANRGLHCVTFIFWDDTIYDLYEAENSYLEIWLKEGENLSTITFKLEPDLTYKIKVGKGIFSSGSKTYHFDSDYEITGYIGWNSAGLSRNDEGYKYHFGIEFTDIHYLSGVKYGISTYFIEDKESNTGNSIWFYPKENSTNS